MKKTLLAILGLALMAVMVSCDGAPPPPPPKDAPKKAAPAKPTPPPPAAAQQQEGWKPGQQTKPVTDGVMQTLDYGVSVGKAYNNSKQKIKNINQQHNQQLEDALKE